jgi:crossover junction endodeoxyribonuclease RusA
VQGRILISAEGRKYRQAIADTVMEQRTGARLSGRLAVAVTVCPPDRRRRDLDNVSKCLLDALTKAGVWQDDEQIDLLVLKRDNPVPGGMVRVAVQEVVA